jgi:GT2 family glycosyltransferase
MKISVVIPTHNRADALELTLLHLSQQQLDAPWEVVVVNNRCTDNTDEVVTGRSFPAPLRLVHEATPGPAAARNAGARQAAGEYLLFMDNDIVVEPDYLKRHLEALSSHPQCWIVAQVVNLPEQEKTPFGRFRKSLFPFYSTEQPPFETDAITAQCLSLPRADFEALGGFDESFFVASGEDRELLMRAKAARGTRLILDPNILVLHNDWAGATIEDFCRRHRLYTQTEPLFWRKYGDSYPRQELVKQNSPPNWNSDSLVLIVRKKLKQLVGSRMGQRVLFVACAAFERTWPWPPLLWRLYRYAAAGAIYRGFQEGLAGASSPSSVETRGVKSVAGYAGQK